MTGRPPSSTAATASNSLESHADFVQSYANRTVYAASLPGPAETRAAFGAFALPYYVDRGYPPTEDFDLEWSYARIGFKDDVLPLESGCVQEPRTSVEVAVIRIANIIRNTPCWRTLLRDANAVAKWRHEAEQEGLGKPLIRTSWQPDPSAVLALAERGSFAQGVAYGPLGQKPQMRPIRAPKAPRAPPTSRVHFVPLAQIRSPISNADLMRLAEDGNSLEETDFEERKRLEALHVSPADVERMRKRALDSAQDDILEDLENRRAIMDRAEALSDHEIKTTFSEMFDYALEECMDDAQNAPTRFGTYGVHFEDGLIPSATESALKAHAASLLDSKLSGQIYRLPREPYNDARDWLPQWEALVDLIHPARYSLASHVTRGYDRGQCIGKTWKEFTSGANGCLRKHVALPPLVTRAGRPRRSCNFQWLPAEFHIEAGADKASFSSYINNVNPITQGEGYDAMATVLGQLVPLFEHVLTDLQRPRRLVIDWQCKDHYREPKDATDEVIENFRDLMAMTNVHWEYDDWENLAVNFPTLPSYKPHPPPPAAWPHITLRGRQLQVIVKETQVLLMPSKLHQPAGRWHVEGLEHERVVAIGIYCLDVKNVSTPSLGLRSATGTPPRYLGEKEAIMAAFGMVDEDQGNQYLGEINLVPGRCVAFPNVYQHRFSAISLLDRTQNGHSTLISFLLIDPTRRITSTLQVPPQQPDWTDLATSGVDDDALVEQQTEERLDLSRFWYTFDNLVKLDD
ncbi:hypothetical protein HDU89_004506 [Geranomyces variabilis]|nr:hypothetical protein HDU89_004506 [Geranomyces variabilis]